VCIPCVSCNSDTLSPSSGVARVDVEDTASEPGDRDRGVVEGDDIAHEEQGDGRVAAVEAPCLVDLRGMG